MTNLEKYDQVFINAFGITAEQLSGLQYQDIPAWDSVGHMQLIAELEDTFGIMMDTDDIIDFSSYEKGKEILAKPEYQIEL
ncbi:MAG: acyl carrier protein [Oscillospiraceae bacterium]|nr:acyl carrier protein [Oscillospiraceae bacterium]